MAEYGVIPSNASLTVSKLKIEVPEVKLSRFKTLLSCSELGPKTYENHREDEKYGVTYAWMSEAKNQWEKEFDWYVPWRVAVFYHLQGLTLSQAIG